MNNEEKSKQIALNKQSGKANGFLETYLISYESAMEMAEWKEKDIIEKVKTWLKENAKNYIEFPDFGRYDYNVDELLEDFEKFEKGL